MKNWIRRLLPLTCALLICAMPILNACACTELYAGAAVTEDGRIWFARTEDYDEDYAKQFYVSPAGAHKAGELYHGCYGFGWTFTHDSYAYTAFQDALEDGICPDCGGTHAHTPYQSGGTNEMGVSLTATETLYPSDEAAEQDPFTDEGIEEAEIPTILLGEAATAREAVELLATIYDTVGSNSAGATLIADREETWYMENLSGTQYVAVKLNEDILMFEPNVGIIGAIDLDDEENIIASKDLIATAKAAGTFVGDEAQNVIDCAASYGTGLAESSGSRAVRLTAGLAKLYADDAAAEDAILQKDYNISNIGEDGEIVKPCTKLQAANLLSRQDIFDLYATPGIAKSANVETHIFSIDPTADEAFSVVEWVAMGNMAYSVFVPYYPMLTTDVCDAYNDEAGYYWSFENLSHLAEEDEDNAQAIQEQLRAVQSEIAEEWESLQAEIAQAEDPSAVATEGSRALAEKAYEAALEIRSAISAN